MIAKFLAWLFGASWKTTVSMIGGTIMAALTWLSTVSYDQGAIAMIIPPQYKPWVSKIAGLATLILFAYNGIRQKDKSVVGGTVQQTVSGAIADSGTQTLVDHTVKASIASGDSSVTPEQKAAVNLDFPNGWKAKMKTPIFILAAIALGFSQMGGCATTSSFINPPNARTATALVCTNALLFVKTDAERTATANYIYAVAQAVRSLSCGKVPTPDEMKAAINAFTPASQKYVVLATNIGSIYGAFYPQIISSAGDKTKTALSYLENIAAGCEDAAAAYRPK